MRLISVDDYSELNYKAADILKFYNLPAIFFIEANGRQCIEQIIRLSEMGFEIGSHTITHKHLRPCGKEQAEYEIKQSKKAIETALNKKVDWLCLPRGRWDQTVLDLCEEAGYKYIRTTKIFDTSPLKKGIVNTTIHACPIRPEYNGKDWLKVAIEYLDKIKKEGGLYHLWFHSLELTKYDQWDNIKILFELLSQYEKDKAM